MQTHFTLAQLQDDPGIAEANQILRSCVHCGFCLSACPTYTLLGDERDSPRGRIYLIKSMLESGTKPERDVTVHFDRCLSCLSCMSACPSGVDYMHLIDGARTRVEREIKRPMLERTQRALLSWLLPRPALFRLALMAAQPARPFARLVPGRLGAMLRLASAPAPPSPLDKPQVFPAKSAMQKRVALLTGCVQKVVAPAINEATVRLLTRLGCEVEIVDGLGCCGALDHHMGRAEAAHDHAARAVKAIMAAHRARALDAVVVNASGCGTALKDYGHLFKHEPALAADAATVASLARDVSELVRDLNLRPTRALGHHRIAYHSACSLQHGQKITELPKQLLVQAGFVVVDVPEGHLCCGSAGTYNLMQPALASQLGERKAANIARVAPAMVAAGNVGCLVQIKGFSAVPVVHTVELLDWATGGPAPASIAQTVLAD
ncbi:MAG: glycolate oxidase subunit GlcF [Alphaproteobacteria bacterium]|nr:glycolate oxidase subunit GlcF [Alphaproteobacteria bacterium]